MILISFLSLSLSLSFLIIFNTIIVYIKFMKDLLMQKDNLITGKLKFSFRETRNFNSAVTWMGIKW